jgi:hypothetical protein
MQSNNLNPTQESVLKSPFQSSKAFLENIFRDILLSKRKKKKLMELPQIGKNCQLENCNTLG